MKKIVLFILVPVFLTTLGEFFLKFNINAFASEPVFHPRVKHLVESVPFVSAPVSEKISDGLMYLVTVAFNPGVVFALFCIILGGVLWVVAMSKFELSFLYPFLSINYAAIVVGSGLILGEQVSLYRYISVALIMIGLVFISKSPYSDSQADSKSTQERSPK